MGLLIKKDKSGAILSQVVMGRGRPPKGATKQSNGDFIMIIDENSNPVVEKKYLPIERSVSVITTSFSPKVEVKEVEFTDKTEVKKQREATTQIDYKDIYKYFQPIKKTETNSNLVLAGVCLKKNMEEVPEIKFNGVYSKFEINKLTGDFIYWGDETLVPKLVVKKLFTNIQ